MPMANRRDDQRNGERRWVTTDPARSVKVVWPATPCLEEEAALADRLLGREIAALWAPAGKDDEHE